VNWIASSFRCSNIAISSLIFSPLQPQPRISPFDLSCDLPSIQFFLALLQLLLLVRETHELVQSLLVHVTELLQLVVGLFQFFEELQFDQKPNY
jgi:hypothetical protein